VKQSNRSGAAQNAVLDEMQQQTLWQLMARCYSLCWCGLAAAILLQIVWVQDLRLVAAEWLIFMVVNGYMLIGLLRAGIWSGGFCPSAKTNLLVSAGVGVFCFLWTGAIWVLRVARGIPTVDFPWGLAVGLLVGGFAFTWLGLRLSLTLHQKRRRQLDQGEED